MHALYNLRSDIYAAMLEFFGATTFLLLGLGSIQSAVGAAEASENEPSILLKDLYIATCMGLSLIASAWIFFRVTGGVFNPNLSLALLLIGAISPTRFVLYCIAQLSGAIAASGVILALIPGPIAFKFVPVLLNGGRMPIHFSQHYSAEGSERRTRSVHRDVHHHGPCPFSAHASC
jgi:glycerol uptake facilitator-like aquaporin